MKAKQSKQLQSCSKTGLKKSSVSKASVLIPVIVLFFLHPAPLRSLELTHTLFTRESTFSIRITMVDFPVQKVRNVFQKRETTQVRFEVRLFRETTGLLSFLGDQLIGEHNDTYHGSYDPFYEMFHLETSDDSHDFLQEENFFSAFRSYYTSFVQPEAEADRIYLKARITFTPRKLMPPLNVLEPFLLDSRETTGWVRIPVPAVEKPTGGSP